MASGKVFEEHLGVISALKDNFTRQEDAETLRALIAVQAEIKERIHAHESEVQQAIRELTSQVEASRIKAAYPDQEGAHDQRLQALESSIIASRKHISQLTAELQAVEDARKVTGDKMREVAVHKAKLDHVLLQSEPHIRHQLSLYAHVSKISWEFGAGGRVAGTVSDPVSTDLRHFDLPEGSLSQFEMTNAIWDLVAAEGSVQT